MTISDVDPFLKQHENFLVANRIGNKPIPVVPLTNQPIRGDKLKHLMGFDEAMKLLAMDYHDDVVFYYTEECPLVVVDMDNCLNNGVLLPPFRAILDKHPTYVEVSSSGTGLHAYYQCPITEKHSIGNKAIYYLNEPIDSASKAIKCELIAKKHLCVMTGNTFENSHAHGVRFMNDLSTTIAQNLPHRPRSQLESNIQYVCATHNQILGRGKRCIDHIRPASCETSIEDARNALYCLNPDMDHDSWIQIGMAIHSEWPNGHGRELFEVWSRQGESFQIRDFNCAWKSFKQRSGGITIKTLFSEAKKNGYRPQRKNVYEIRRQAPPHHDPSQARETETPPPPPPAIAYPEPEQHQPNIPPVQFLSMKQLIELPQPEWLIPELIPAHAIGQLFGATQTYKSFIALHLSLCMTQGSCFLGMPVKKGQVLYMCGERIEDFGKRVLGWQEQHQLTVTESPDIYFSRGCYDITSPYKTGQFLAYLQWLQHNRDFDPDLIVIDTLSKAFWLNENSTEDMGLFLKALEKIRDATGASILLIHHCGHNGAERARGSSRLPDDLDFNLRSHREQGTTNQATLSIIKQKDAELLDDIPIFLNKVDTEKGSTLAAALRKGCLPESKQHYMDQPLRQNETFCTKPPQGLPKKPKQPLSRSITDNQRKAYYLLKEMTGKRANVLEGRITHKEVSSKEFKMACMDESLTDYNHWSRFQTNMLMNKLITLKDGYCFPVERDDV